MQDGKDDCGVARRGCWPCGAGEEEAYPCCSSWPGGAGEEDADPCCSSWPGGAGEEDASPCCSSYPGGAGSPDRTTGMTLGSQGWQRVAGSGTTTSC